MNHGLFSPEKKQVNGNQGRLEKYRDEFPMFRDGVTRPEYPVDAVELLVAFTSLSSEAMRTGDETNPECRSQVGELSPIVQNIWDCYITMNKENEECLRNNRNGDSKNINP